MHNKFVIIDRSEVWMGSMNHTVTSAYNNNNNLVRIRSSKIGENYTVEFEEMFVDEKFGSGTPNNTPNPVIQIDDNQVEVYFSPDDGVRRRLLDLINSAEQSIHFLAFVFTDDDLSSALIQRYSQGIEVMGVFEESQVNSSVGEEFNRMHEAGLDVRLDGKSYKMHHKVMIIDSEIVITGSYNFSKSAETRNDENILVFHNQEVAVLFLKEFKKIYHDAK